MVRQFSSPPPFIDSHSLPWQSISPGFSLKVLRAVSDDEARVLLLRVAPGTVIERHQHEGDVHAFTLSGQRRIRETGEVIGAGGYNYEPAGNVDSWEAVGDEPVLVMVVVRGAMSYLDERGRPTRTTTSTSVAEGYRRFRESLAAASPNPGKAERGEDGPAGRTHATRERAP